MTDATIDRLKPASHARVPALDGIRGLAIVLVLFCHLWPGEALTGGLSGHSLHAVSVFVQRLSEASWVGVDLFFVLSGFLITGILLDTREGEHYFRNFYMRRTLRIFPLYFGVIAAATVVSLLIHDFAAMKEHLPYLLTYTENVEVTLRNDWSSGTRIFRFMHFWSLAVEEHFYLVWPAIILLCRNRKLVVVSCGIIVLAAVSKVLVWRYWNGEVGGYTLTPCRMDSMAIGGLTCLAVRAGWRRWWILPVVASPVIVAVAWNCGYESSAFWAQMAGAPAMAVLFAGMIGMTLEGGTLRRLFSGRTLRWFGTYSYGLYVFHLLFQPGVVALRSHFYQGPGKGVLDRGMLLVIAVVMALVSFHGFEMPFQRLKRYFEA